MDTTPEPTICPPRVAAVRGQFYSRRRTVGDARHRNGNKRTGKARLFRDAAQFRRAGAIDLAAALAAGRIPHPLREAAESLGIAPTNSTAKDRRRLRRILSAQTRS